MPLLDKSLPIPLYHQLAEELRKQIESGEWPLHTLISSETQLCKKYGVSRGTVRQALIELMRDGLIYRKQGQGTFVAKLRVIQPVSRFYSFAQDMMEKGLEPSLKLIQSEIIYPNSAIRKVLELTDEKKVYKIVRARLANGEPVLLDISYLIEELFPGLEKEDLATTPLYNLIIRKYRVRISRAREAFEPILVNKFEAKQLNVSVGSLALLVKRTVYAEDRPFEFRRTVVRGDKCTYSIELI